MNDSLLFSKLNLTRTTETFKTPRRVREGVQGEKGMKDKEFKVNKYDRNTNIGYKEITVMEQQAKFNKEALKALPADTIPKTESMVKTISLANGAEKEVAKSYASLVVKYEGKSYLMQQQSLVPPTAELVRDSQNALVGIPVVVGGSL